MTKLLLGVAWVGCLGMVGCSRGKSPTPTASAGSLSAHHQQMAKESMAESDRRAPALEWLSNTSKHMLWKGDRSAIFRHFEEQQRAGAKEIWAVDLGKEDGHEIYASFVLVLPEGAPRARLISQHNQFWKNYLGSEASAEDLQEFTIGDDGQPYIFYNFDLWTRFTNQQSLACDI